MIERSLGRNLLYLACRHHVHELLVQVSFETCFGKSTAPEAALFVKFRKGWAAVDTKNYKPVEDRRLKSQLGKKLVQENMIFFETILEENSFLRDDYKEFAQLCHLALGGVPNQNFQFKTCGACHHARWMSKCIYGLKIYLFR